MEILLGILAALHAASRAWQSIMDILDQHAGELPEEARKRLEEVKARRKAAEEEWTSDLSPIVPLPDPTAPGLPASHVAEDE